MTAVDDWIANLRAFKTTDVSAPRSISSPLITDVNLVIAALQQLQGASGGVSMTSGSWTPTLLINGVTTGITYSRQVGEWVRWNGGAGGIMTFVNFSFTLSSKGAQVGPASMSGLPFASVSNNQVNLANEWQNMTLVAGGTQLDVSVDFGATTLTLVSSNPTTAGAFAVQTNTQFTNTSRIDGAGCYNSV